MAEQNQPSDQSSISSFFFLEDFLIELSVYESFDWEVKGKTSVPFWATSQNNHHCHAYMVY